MSVVGRGLDLFLALIGVAAWGLTAFFVGSRLVSPAAGGLLGLGLGLSCLALVVSSYLQDARLQRLSAGLCPRCRQPIASEHRHRRWEQSRAAWLAPTLAWECDACGYRHDETWACPNCPPAD